MTNYTVGLMFIWAAASVMCWREQIWPKEHYVLDSWLTVMGLMIMCAVIEANK